MSDSYCSNCGQPLDPGTRFCTSCGTAVDASDVSDASVGTGSTAIQPTTPAPPTSPSPNLPPPAGPSVSPAYTGTAGGFSVGNAFNYGWTKLQANFGAILGAMILYLLVGVVLIGIFYALMAVLGGIGRSSVSCGTGNYTYDYYGNMYSTGASCDANGFLASLGVIGFLVTIGLYAVVLTAYFYLIQAGIVRGALAITYGRKIEINVLFNKDRLGTVILTGIGVGIASGIGYMLCWLPGLIITFFSQFFVFFIIDKRLGAMDSVKASWSFVNKNLGSLIGLYIASIIAIIIGELLCGIGLLIAIPVVIIAQTYAYRTLQGESVAA